MLTRFLIGFVLAIVGTSGWASVATIQQIRLWPAPESVRVVFDLSKAIDAKHYTLQNPDRVVIEFKQTSMRANIAALQLTNTGIKKIRSGKHQDFLRIVIEATQLAKVNSFALSPNQYYGHRFVVDMTMTKKPPVLSLSTPLLTQHPQAMIAIDAGHGGEDPGAVGPKGTKEKDVVLAIAKQLTQMINQQKNMQAVLMRHGDYYIGVSERMRKARAHRADLFVSIHADAVKNRHAEGASVFILSQHASSDLAKWLADAANRSDVIGGVNLEDKSDMLASVLLDLSRSANDVVSLKAAQHVLTSLGQTTKLHKTQVERARFAVLKAPDMPSILVESGFISNPKVELKLRDKRYQKQIASAILHGIKAYFDNKPQLLYTVKRGDTLSGIAFKHKMSLASLIKVNKLKHKQIRIGQQLTLPTPP